MTLRGSLASRLPPRASLTDDGCSAGSFYLFYSFVLANLSLPDMRMESHSTDDKAIENFRFKDDGKVIVIHVEQGSKMQKNVSPWASEWR